MSDLGAPLNSVFVRQHPIWDVLDAHRLPWPAPVTDNPSTGSHAPSSCNGNGNEPAASQAPSPVTVTGIDTEAVLLHRGGHKKSDATPHSVVHRLRGARRDSVAPAVEAAQRRCEDPFDSAEVWAVLEAMAQAKVPPLFGCTDEGIQYLRNGQPDNLTRDALAKRVARSKERALSAPHPAKHR